MSLTTNFSDKLFCECIKSDNTKCNKLTYAGYDICELHLKLKNLQQQIDSKDELKPNIKIYRFPGVHTNAGNLKILDLIKESTTKYSTIPDRYNYVKSKLKTILIQEEFNFDDIDYLLNDISDYIYEIFNFDDIYEIKVQ